VRYYQAWIEGADDWSFENVSFSDDEGMKNFEFTNFQKRR
jgi:hypothetical protein